MIKKHVEMNGLRMAILLVAAAGLLAALADATAAVGEDAPAPAEDRVPHRTVTLSDEAMVLQKEAAIALQVQGRQTNVAVELIAYEHTYTNQRSHACYEFQIRSKEPGRFIWSCWVADWPNPHRFQVWTTESGTSYVCYIRRGVHLFRLTESRHPDPMRRLYWEAPGEDRRHPDALPLLPIQWIKDALGPAAILVRPTWHPVEVLELSDREGELRVTVRGEEPQPIYYSNIQVPPELRERWLRSRATFALRGGRWELVSATPQ